MKRNYENLRATDMYRTLSENLSNMPFSFVYNGIIMLCFEAPRTAKLLWVKKI